MIEVDPLAFDNQGAFLHLSIDGPDILTQNADGNQLDRAKEKYPDYQRRDANRKIVPEHELVNEVAQSGQGGNQRVDVRRGIGGKPKVEQVMVKLA